jgi:hypothetical protein
LRNEYPEGVGFPCEAEAGRVCSKEDADFVRLGFPRRGFRFSSKSATPDAPLAAGGYDSALALIASNSDCVMAPASSSSFALAISAAEPPAASCTYSSNAAF